MDKNEGWTGKGFVRITARELWEVVSASGKVVDGSLSYVLAKWFERVHTTDSRL